MDLHPDRRHIPFRTRKPEDKSKVEAPFRQPRLGGIGNDGLSIGQTLRRYLPLHVFHSRRVDIEREDLSLFPDEV